MLPMNEHGRNCKIIYVLLDGVGDLAHPNFGNTTPLEAANTPNLDFLASKGCMGNVLSVGKGIAPQSDIAVFNMLGYSFRDGSYVGRGVIEAIGSGIDFKNGDLALRGNFATVDADGRILDRRAGRNIQASEARELCNSLNNTIKFSDPDVSISIVPTISHRVVIRLRHAKHSLSEKISNTDPAYTKVNGIGIAKASSSDERILESRPEDNSDAAFLSANLVNEFTTQSLEVLRDHPVNKTRSASGSKNINGILTRDSGNKYPNLESMYSRYGLNFGAIVDMPVEVGISSVLGMKMFRAGNVQDYQVKALHAIDRLEELDAMYIHIKGPDEFGHDGDWEGKKNNIEAIDRLFFGPLVDRKDIEDTLIVVSGDHSTPCIKNSHSDDPVPVLFSGCSVKSDGSERFTEYWGQRGKIGLVLGEQVLNQILAYRSKNKAY